MILEILNYHKNNVKPSNITIELCLKYLLDSIKDYQNKIIKQFQLNNIYLITVGKLLKNRLINSDLRIKIIMVRKYNTHMTKKGKKAHFKTTFRTFVSSYF